MKRPSRRSVFTAVFAAVFLTANAGTLVSAASADVGFRDQPYSGTGTPTGSKPESKLWWNDGFWWANMWDTVTQDFHIFRLDLSTQKWIDTGVKVDGRAYTRADTLWDGTHLYVASHIYSETPTAANPSRLYRFSYSSATRTYTLDVGYPVAINDYSTETLVIDKDSTGKLWATWMQNNQVYVNRTTTNDATWGTPFVLPVAGTTAASDDISSVVAFGGNKIGVMWSNQVDSAMYFAVHVDGQADTAWDGSRTAIAGPNYADDHINLKSLQADGSGRVFAAVKTSLDDLLNPNPNAPLIMLLVREPATGDWSSYVFGRVSEHHTRPILLLDETNRVIHMFATAPVNGGVIYEKTSPLDAISFPTGLGTPFIQDAASLSMNNATSTKQNVNSTTGLFVLAANSATNYYWHNYEALPAPPPKPTPPTASFTGTPTSGTAPLTVNFTDTSSGSPTSWSWDFGDGGTATVQNPAHTYALAGTYSVSLTVANAAGTDTATKVGYVTVTAPLPDFSLSASPTNQTVLRGGSVRYTVTITPLNGFTGTVDLSVSGVPDGVTASFAPDPVTVGSTTFSTLTVTTSSATKLGSFTLVIAGTSGSLRHTTSVALQVKKK